MVVSDMGAIHTNLILLVFGIVLIGGCLSEQSITESKTQLQQIVDQPKQEPTQLMECLRYNKAWDDWSGFVGVFCSSTQQCWDIVKSSNPNYDEAKDPIKCSPTSYKRMKKDGIYISCNTNDDCLTQTGLKEALEIALEDTSSLSVEELKTLDSIEQMVRCEENFCEATKGLLDKSETTMGCHQYLGANGTRTCTYCRGEECKTIIE